MNVDLLYTELFQQFEGRTDDLKKVTRYGNFPVVHYRSSLYEHCRRLVFLLQSIEKIIRDNGLDFDRLVVMALVHDDVEIVIGDIVAGDKAIMNTEQLQVVANAESRAIDQLANRFPEMVGSYIYADLLREAHALTTPESQLLKYIDRFDAFGEALHEIYAGNPAMTIPVMSAYGQNPTPFEFYIGYLSHFPEYYPHLRPLFEAATGIFKTPSVADFKAIAKAGALHIHERFSQPAGYEPYDIWKQVIQTFGGDADLLFLLTPTE